MPLVQSVPLDRVSACQPGGSGQLPGSWNANAGSAMANGAVPPMPLQADGSGHGQGSYAQLLVRIHLLQFGMRLNCMAVCGKEHSSHAGCTRELNPAASCTFCSCWNYLDQHPLLSSLVALVPIMLYWP